MGSVIHAVLIREKIHYGSLALFSLSDFRDSYEYGAPRTIAVLFGGTPCPYIVQGTASRRCASRGVYLLNTASNVTCYNIFFSV